MNTRKLRSAFRRMALLADTLFLLAFLVASAIKAAVVQLRTVSVRGLLLDAAGIITLVVVWVIFWRWL